MDDPLRAIPVYNNDCYIIVLIPLLVDDPLRVIVLSLFAALFYVLIPLLVDDPLRVKKQAPWKAPC